MLNKIIRWFSDPFGKKELIEKHDLLLEAMKETTARSQRVIPNDGRYYPFASTLNRGHRTTHHAN